MWARTVLCCLMLATLIGGMIPAVPAEASAKSVALGKYRELLKKRRVSVIPQGKEVWYDYYKPITYYSSNASSVKFSIAYIDGDDVPELILQDPKIGYGVWTYKGRCFRCLYWEDCFGAPVGYFKKRGVFRNNSYTEGSPFHRGYYRLKTGKKAVQIQHQKCNNGEYGVQNWGFYVGNKRVSSSKFYKNLKKNTGGAKMTPIYMHWNTWNNRKRYIK